MNRGYVHWAIAGVLLPLSVAASGCFQPTQLLLAINTDMAPGKDIDRMEVEITTQDGTTVHRESYLINPTEEGSVSFPATLGIVPESELDGPVTIRVRAYQGASSVPRVETAPVVRQIPEHQVSYVNIEIPFLCAGKVALSDGEESVDGVRCAKGETCMRGSCIPDTNTDARLVVPQDYPRDGLLADQACLDVLSCFDAGAVVVPDLPGCTVAGAGPDVNVALLTEEDGICGDTRCLVPLALDKEGQLPPEVCNKLFQEEKILGVIAAPVTPSCPRRGQLTPIAGPWSSVAACRKNSEEFPPLFTNAADEPFQKRAGHAVTMLDSRTVLVTGGIFDTGGSRVVRVGSLKFQPDEPPLWTSNGTPNMQRPRTGHSATLLSGPGEENEVLIAGGTSSPEACLQLTGTSGGDDTLEILQISGTVGSSESPPHSTMSSDRYLHTATLLGYGKVVLLAGGFAKASVDGDPDESTDTADVFDRELDGGTLTPTRMLERRVGHTATALNDGSVLVVGGLRTRGRDEGEVLPTAERFEPSSFSWVADAPLSPPGVESQAGARAFHTATRLDDNDDDWVLVAGGFRTDPRKLLDKKEPPFEELSSALLDGVSLYHKGRGASQGSWFCAPRMHIARAFHTATLLDDGRVLVLGGLTLQGYNAPPEIYDPSTNSWTLVSSPELVPRFLHTVTPLGDGRHFIYGGLFVDSEDDLKSSPLDKLVRRPFFFELPCSLGDSCTKVAVRSPSQDSCGQPGETPNGSEPPTPPVALAPVEWRGGGCAEDPGVTREGCGLGSTPGSGTPFALLLLALIARRRRSLRAD